MSNLYVVGYYNANTFPINIFVPQLRGSIQLGEGQFILNDDGRKINDPIFENYCGPNRLQRETSREKVPLVRVPQAVNEPTKVGFTGASKHSERQPVPDKVVPHSTGVITFSSVAEAEKAGFIKPRPKMVVESQVVETSTATAGGVQAPIIEFADQDVAEKPELSGTLKPTIIDIPQRPPEVPKAPTPKAVLQTVKSTAMVENDTTPVKGQPLPKIELPPELQTTGPIIESTGIKGFTHDTVNAGVTPRQPTSMAPPTNLPDPVINEEPEKPVSPKPKVELAPGKFKCPLCPNSPKTYQRRSQLGDHVKYKHPESYKEVMAKIPLKSE
jgi:hypothetical protein